MLRSMGEQRASNFELRLDRLQDETASGEEQRGILEIFDQGEPGSVRDEDAALRRDSDE
jgi:hypothetical protein